MSLAMLLVVAGIVAVAVAALVAVLVIARRSGPPDGPEADYDDRSKQS